MSINLALNPFKKGKKAEVEVVRHVEVEKDPVLQNLINHYLAVPAKEYIDRITRFEFKFTPDPDLFYIPELPPHKINTFLNYLIDSNNLKTEKNGFYELTTHYISKLIQKSYDRGNNNFQLNTQDTHLEFLCSRLNGLPDNPIKINVNDNIIGGYFGTYSKYIDVEFSGNGGYRLGNQSEHSKFKVNGDLFGQCGQGSEKSEFIIRGNGGFQFACFCNGSKFTLYGDTNGMCVHSAQNCDVSFYGKIHNNDCGHYSNNTIVRTIHEDSYDTIIKNIPNTSDVQLIDKNGKIIKEHKRCH